MGNFVEVAISRMSLSSLMLLLKFLLGALYNKSRRNVLQFGSSISMAIFSMDSQARLFIGSKVSNLIEDFIRMAQPPSLFSLRNNVMGLWYSGTDIGIFGDQVSCRDMNAGWCSSMSDSVDWWFLL